VSLSQTAYGRETSQTVEWFETSKPSASSLLVAVHGGYWRAQYGSDHLRPFCTALSAGGFRVCSLEYRRVGEAGGGWPGTLEDIASALAFVRAAVIAQQLDVSSLLLVGHSAGGQLALWAAARAGGNASGGLPVSGVVALAPLSDLVEAARLNLSNGAVGEFLGGSPQQFPERYWAASPVECLPLGVPTVLVHGTDDVDVPYALSPAYVKRAVAAGDVARLLTLEGAGHFDLIQPESPFFPEVLAAIEALR
jgi:acetyl esterase/lipase